MKEINGEGSGGRRRNKLENHTFAPTGRWGEGPGGLLLQVQGSLPPPPCPLSFSRVSTRCAQIPQDPLGPEPWAALGVQGVAGPVGGGAPRQRRAQQGALMEAEGPAGSRGPSRGHPGSSEPSRGRPGNSEPSRGCSWKRRPRRGRPGRLIGQSGKSSKPKDRAENEGAESSQDQQSMRTHGSRGNPSSEGHRETQGHTS